MSEIKPGVETPLPFPALPVETARLTLRLLTMDDLAAVHAYQSRPDVTRYLPYDPKNLEAAQVSLERVCATSSFEEDGRAFVLAVIERSTGALIGEVMLFSRNAVARQGEVGYVFHPDFHGQGYAYEAVEAIVDLGFGHFGLHRMCGRCSAANVASANLMKKLGMRMEAHFREHEIFKGEWDELQIFAILEDEWRARKGDI